MSRLYISEKTLSKFSESVSDQKYLQVLSRFKIDQSKPKQAGVKNSQSRPASKKPSLNHNTLSRDDEISIALLKMKKEFAENKNQYHYSAEKAKKLSKEIKAKKRNAALKKLSKQSALVKPRVIRIKKKQVVSKKSTKPLVHSLDYDNPAAEYESRQVEFGHGRAKSKEWNDEIARKFQKELKGRHKKKDWTDRFALK